MATPNCIIICPYMQIDLLFVLNQLIIDITHGKTPQPRGS